MIVAAWDAIVGNIAVVAGGLVAVGGILRALYRFFKKLDNALSAVHRELLPNGGSSLRDAVNRIEERINLVEGRTAVLEHWRAEIEVHHFDPPVE